MNYSMIWEQEVRVCELLDTYLFLILWNNDDKK